MQFRHAARTVLMVAIGVGTIAAAAPVGAPLAALAQILPGQWQLKEVGVDSGRSICVADTRAILQLAHPGIACQRLVITNEADRAVVQYSCPGNGTGRTTIVVSTPRAFRLTTQGIADGSPFDFDYDAHRIGACQPGAKGLR